MILCFTVNAVPHQVEIPESEELHIAIQGVYGSLVAACGDVAPDPFLQARLIESLLAGFDEQSNPDLGEIASPQK